MRNLINIVSKLYEEDEQGILTIDEHSRKKYTDSQGRPHRIGGPASIIGAEGSNCLYYYYIHGKKHRIDGPAVYYLDGTNKQYYLYGNLIKPHTIMKYCKKEFFNNQNQYENFILQILIKYSMLHELSVWDNNITIKTINNLKHSTINDDETIQKLNVILKYLEFLNRKIH